MHKLELSKLESGISYELDCIQELQFAVRELQDLYEQQQNEITELRGIVRTLGIDAGIL